MKKTPDLLFWIVLAALIVVGIPVSLVFTGLENDRELRRLVLAGSLLDGEIVTSRTRPSRDPASTRHDVTIRYALPDGKTAEIREEWKGEMPAESLQPGAVALVYYQAQNKRLRVLSRNHPAVLALKTRLEKKPPPAS